MRKSSQLRSAVQSAPLTLRGVSVRLASRRRVMIIPQRDASGPLVRCKTCVRNRPSMVPNAPAGKPPDASVNSPTALRERLAVGGTSYRTSVSSSSSSSSFSGSSEDVASVAVSSAGAAEGAVGAPSEGRGTLLPGGGEGRDAGGGAGSLKPGGNSDSGPCWPSTGMV